MSESVTPSPPAWVHKRDGRLVPFEADKISRALFAATESLGRPDAFLARELTDGVVHFLSVEQEGAVPTTAQVAESVVKVVRELGQPALSQVFLEGVRKRDAVDLDDLAKTPANQITIRLSVDDSPTKVLRDFARSYTLQMVFARDIVAAHRDGLLALSGLETPQDLAGCVLELPPPGKTLTEAFFDARNHVANCVAVDGPEFLISEYLRSIRREQNELANSIVKRWWIRELAASLSAAGLRAIVNLNNSSPPLWAEDLASGPLFLENPNAPDPKRLTALGHALLADLVHSERDPLRVNWHLSGRDFVPENAERLAEVARHALDGNSLAFVFDRPRRSVSLGEGMDRRHSSALMTLGLNLPRLAEQQGVLGDSTKFLDKLGSLARLALSAGVQKREFLRRVGKDRPALVRGFLLGRARLLVAPIGLESVVRAMTGEGIAQETGLRFAKQIVEKLNTVLQKDGLATRLESCLDAPLIQDIGATQAAENSDSPPTGPLPTLDKVAGLTTWDAKASWKSQLKATGALHSLAGQGTACLLLPEDPVPAPEEVVEWLSWAWHNTEVMRLRLMRPIPVHQQLTLAIGEKDLPT
ncbi:MAG: ATP cone domain-containing protein [Gemmataceae bacterium]